MPPFHVHPDVVLLLGGLWAAYVIAVRRHQEGDPSAAHGSPRRIALFSAGMLTLIVASTWPVHDLAEDRLYAVHMFQHMTYTLVAPPLLIAGIPAWMWRAFLRGRTVAAVFRFLVRPLVALVLFNGVLLFTHWPAVVEASVGSELVHFALHVLVVGSADPVGLSRLARGLVELPEIVPAATTRVVVNRVRSSLGWGERDVSAMVEGFVTPASMHFLPEDRVAADRALVAGRPLVDAGESALRSALGRLVDTLDEDRAAPAPVRRGRFLRRRAQAPKSR